MPGAVVEHHADRATITRERSPDAVASSMFASLCFNLHFQPFSMRAAKYALANLIHSNQRLRLLGSLKGMIARAHDRWSSVP